MDELESTCYEFTSFLAQRGIVCGKDDTITVKVPLKAVQNVMEIVQTIEKEMEDSKGRMERELMEHAEEMERIDTEGNQMEKKIEDLQKYVLQVENQNEELRCTASELEMRIEKQDGLLTEQQDDMRLKEKTIEEIQSESHYWQERVNTMRNDLLRARELGEHIRIQLQAKGDVDRKAQEMQREHESICRTHQMKIGTLEDQICALRDELQDNEACILELQGQNTKLFTEGASTRKDCFHDAFGGDGGETRGEGRDKRDHEVQTDEMDMHRTSDSLENQKSFVETILKEIRNKRSIRPIPLDDDASPKSDSIEYNLLRFAWIASLFVCILVAFI
jgi:DNA repair exonuclease SbcCD ATPase subunit